MIRFLVIILAGVLLAPPAAQSNPDYPNKPVRIIVNVAPGGGVDTATRIIADKLRARLGQPFVVENRPGAGGNIGAEVVFQSEGDGYTLLASSPTPLAINGWLYKKLNFDPAGFEPVAMMSRIPNVLVVRPDFPAKSVQEVVAVAKANPGKFTFASQGIGTASHLTGELFMTLTGTRLVHVPYKGNTSNVLTDVVAGHVDVPTVAESGLPGFEAMLHFGLLAPAATPRPVIDRLNGELKILLASEEAKKRIAADGGDPFASTPVEYEAYIASETAKWSALIRRLDLKAD